MKFKVKPRINKANNQINFSIPRRKISKKALKDILKKEELTIYLKDL